MREAQPITTQNPSVGHYHFAAAFPSHREHIALQRQPFASAWLVAILHVEGFKTCAKHRPSRHKTRLSAFTALPLPSQVTAHTLTCSGSPVPVSGHVAIIHVPPCHCFPRSPRTRCPAAAALCQRLAMSPYRHTPLHPFRGFHNLREARAIRTQNPRVGLYRIATAFPGHREHVALQQQSFASAWPCRHTPFRGFQNVREARPITTQNPSVGLYRFATLPSQVTAHTLPCSGSPLPAPGHVAILHLEGFKTCAKHGPSRHKTRLWAFTALPLLSQVTANTLPCLCQRLASRHTQFRGFQRFQNVREAQPITTQNPSVGHYHFAAAFPSHREHIALQRQPFASAWLVAILHVEGFKTCAKNRPSRHKTRLSAFTTLPLPSQVTAHTLTCSGSPVPVPGHVAIIHVPPCHCFPRSPRTRCPAAAALCQRLAMSPYRHTPLHPFRGFHNLREARAIRTQNSRVGLYRFATAFPGHREHVALQQQSFASAWPCRHTPFIEGFKTCAKHGPSRHKTRLWAFTALPLPSQVTAHTLPCSGSPLPAPGHVTIYSI